MSTFDLLSGLSRFIQKITKKLKSWWICFSYHLAPTEQVTYSIILMYEFLRE